MPDKRITQLSAITYDQVNATDVAHVGQTSADKSITFPQLKKYVLQNTEIGGTASGDIVTTTDTQTLSGKRINSLKLNSDTAITTDSEQLNKLDGLTAEASQINILDGATITTAQLNRLSGVATNISTSLANRIVRYSTAQSILYTYGQITEATSTVINIGSATILAAHSLSTGTTVVDGNCLTVSCWQVNTGTEQRTLDGTPKINMSANGTGLKVDSIDFTVTSGKTYHMMITFSPAALSSPV